MNFRQVQPNFSRGEIAPELYGRFDVDAWAAGVKKARNVVVLKYGGLTKRPGTQLVGEVFTAEAPNRLVPFQFSLTQTYALELGQGYMAPLANGGRVVEEELAILHISNAADAAITATAHGYGPGDHVFLSGIEGEIGGLLNGVAWGVKSVPSADVFTIEADTSGMAAFTGATGSINRTSAPPPPPSSPPVTTPTPPEPPPPVYGGGGWEWMKYRNSGYIV